MYLLLKIIKLDLRRFPGIIWIRSKILAVKSSMSPVQDNVFSDDFHYLIFHFYGVFVRWVSILYYDYSLFINENFTSLCKHQWTVFKHIKLWKLLKITTVWGKHSCEALVYQKTGFVVLVLLKNIRWSDVGTNVCYQKSGERILQRHKAA